MADYKKVLITVPDELLCEADCLASLQKMTRSKLIRDAMMLYIKEEKQKTDCEMVISKLAKK